MNYRNIISSYFYILNILIFLSLQNLIGVNCFRWSLEKGYCFKEFKCKLRHFYTFIRRHRDERNDGEIFDAAERDYDKTRPI